MLKYQLFVFCASFIVHEALGFFCANHGAVQKTKMFAYRQAYQFHLDAITGHAFVNGTQVKLADASQQMTSDLQKSQAAGSQAESRLDALNTEFEAKEQEHDETIQAMKEELRKQKLDMQEQALEMGNEVTAVKLEARRQQLLVIEEFEDREQALRDEMKLLADKVEEEKDIIRTQKDMSNRILATRIELDKELVLLKKQYEQDSKEWESRLAAEQKAHNRDLLESQRELDHLHHEIEDLEKQNIFAEINKERAESLSDKLNNEHLLTNRILQKRVEIEGELGALKRKYENDQKTWQKKMSTEMAARDDDLAKTKAEMEAMKKKMEEMEAERNNAGFLMGRSFKVMMGLEE